MSRANNKKKSFGQKEMARRNVFYHRLKTICVKMVGEGYFELLPESTLRLLYRHRYPEVKVIMHAKKIMGNDEFVRYKQSLAELLSQNYIETLSSEQISYARFLTDVLVLIHFIQYRAVNRIKGFSKLQAAFAPYFTTTEWFKNQQIKILEQLSLNDLELYDFYKGTFRFSFQRMAMYKVGGKNELHVYRLAHTTALQNVDGKKRAIVRMGRPSLSKADEFEWIYIKPSALGMPLEEGEVALPIYAQQHALDRFEERAALWKGFVQVYISYLFTQGNPKTVVRKGHILLDCVIGGHKVGYFVISQHDDKWLVRTFLFLTNDGTPEGEKLRAITKLQIEDKKYLMIDRMDAFLTYDIANDESLRKIFTKAGCESIILYAEIINRYGNQTLKNPDFIYRYMSTLFR